MSKFSKFSKFSKLPKFPNFPIFLNHAKTKLSTPLYYFFLFLLAPNVTVPVVLWAEACPFASSSTAVPVHHRTEPFMCTKFQPLHQMGGEQTGTLGKNGAWGDATCTCPGTCVPRPCSSLCMVTHVLALQVWLSTCSMVSGREESSMYRLHS